MKAVRPKPTHERESRTAMKFMHRHTEYHRSDRIGWLRAAVLGANDGIVSTASLLIGVAAANASHPSLIVTGTASLPTFICTVA